MQSECADQCVGVSTRKRSLSAFPISFLQAEWVYSGQDIMPYMVPSSMICGNILCNFPYRNKLDLTIATLALVDVFVTSDKMDGISSVLRIARVARLLKLLQSAK